MNQLREFFHNNSGSIDLYTAEKCKHCESPIRGSIFNMIIQKTSFQVKEGIIFTFMAGKLQKQSLHMH